MDNEWRDERVGLPLLGFVMGTSLSFVLWMVLVAAAWMITTP